MEGQTSLGASALLSRLFPGPVALDTSPFIYFLEGHPTYSGLLQPVFDAIDDLDLPACTSALTLLETSIQPLRKGQHRLVELYRAYLTTSEGLDLIALDLSCLRTAAHLRATRRIQTPDALHLAAALEGGCTHFLTKDRRLPSLPGLETIFLDQFLSSDLVMQPPAPPFG